MARVSRRLIHNWKRLVGGAIEAEEERILHGSHWNEYTDTPFVPQILHQQEKNTDNILQTAHSVQDQYPQVARIYIVYEYSYALSQALDPQSESRGILQFKTALLFVIQQKRGKKIDSSEDLYIIQGFYKDLKHKLDQLEDEDWLRQESQYNQTPYVLPYPIHMLLLLVSTIVIMDAPRCARYNFMSYLVLLVFMF